MSDGCRGERQQRREPGTSGTPEHWDTGVSSRPERHACTPARLPTTLASAGLDLIPWATLPSKHMAGAVSVRQKEVNHGRLGKRSTDRVRTCEMWSVDVCAMSHSGGTKR